MSTQTRAIAPKRSSFRSMLTAAAAAALLFVAAPAMAQEAAPAAAPAAPATVEVTPAAAPAAQQQQGSPWTPFIMIGALFAIFYFMMIRPQQRKEKERQKMIAELRAGRKVSFAGGLLGTIKESREATFLIEICDGVTVEVARGAVMAAADAAEPEKK